MSNRLGSSYLFLSALVVALLPAAAAAIVTRHDIPDAAYLARESDYPALFGVYRTKAGMRDCIGTVIDPRWAVTAAHCTTDKRLLDGAAPGGRGYPVSIAGKEVRIDRIVTHSGNGFDGPRDIALLRFAAPVTHVAPIKLYRGSDETDRIVVIPGWGKAGNGRSGIGDHDGLFRVAENMVDQAEDGRLRWKFDAPGPNSRALSLEGISGPGDSGGPALLRTPAGWAIAGVSSAQNTMGGPEGLYGVVESFVRVSEFASWIDGRLASTR